MLCFVFILLYAAFPFSISFSLIYKKTNSQSRIFCDMLEDLLASCPDHERHKNHIEHIAIKRWIPIYKRQDWSDPKLPVLFKRIMKDVLTFEKNHLTSESGKAKLISLQFTRFAVKPEVWKQIQFAHIEFFPAMQW
jgi:hypothetical protein